VRMIQLGLWLRLIKIQIAAGATLNGRDLLSIHSKAVRSGHSVVLLKYHYDMPNNPSLTGKSSLTI